jgi:predicted transcriptional regulator
MRDANLDKTILWTANIVSAYISKNSVGPSGLPSLIGEVHASLAALAGAPRLQPQGEPPKPAVPISKSVSEDYIICLEDGRRFKSLKRHLRVRYDMTPEQYRQRWRLPPHYPMVAPGYVKTRSKMAKSMGLGQPRRHRDKK